MTEEYPYQEPHPMGGTDTGEDEELKEIKPDARQRKQLADRKAMKDASRIRG